MLKKSFIFALFLWAFNAFLNAESSAIESSANTDEYVFSADLPYRKIPPNNTKKQENYSTDSIKTPALDPALDIDSIRRSLSNPKTNLLSYTNEAQSTELPRRAEMDFSEENAKPILSIESIKNIKDIESKIDPAQIAAEQILSSILDAEIQNAANEVADEKMRQESTKQETLKQSPKQEILKQEQAQDGILTDPALDSIE